MTDFIRNSREVVTPLESNSHSLFRATKYVCNFPRAYLACHSLLLHPWIFLTNITVILSKRKRAYWAAPWNWSFPISFQFVCFFLFRLISSSPRNYRSPIYIEEQGCNFLLLPTFFELASLCPELLHCEVRSWEEKRRRILLVNLILSSPSFSQQKRVCPDFWFHCKFQNSSKCN